MAIIIPCQSNDIAIFCIQSIIHRLSRWVIFRFVFKTLHVVFKGGPVKIVEFVTGIAGAIPKEMARHLLRRSSCLAMSEFAHLHKSRLAFDTISSSESTLTSNFRSNMSRELAFRDASR